MIGLAQVDAPQRFITDVRVKLSYSCAVLGLLVSIRPSSCIVPSIPATLPNQMCNNGSLHFFPTTLAADCAPWASPRRPRPTSPPAASSRSLLSAHLLRAARTTKPRSEARSMGHAALGSNMISGPGSRIRLHHIHSLIGPCSDEGGMLVKTAQSLPSALSLVMLVRRSRRLSPSGTAPPPAAPLSSPRA